MIFQHSLGFEYFDKQKIRPWFKLCYQYTTAFFLFKRWYSGEHISRYIILFSYSLIIIILNLDKCKENSYC